VKTVETHYGVKRMHIPLMGVANLFLKVAHPAGTKSLHVAIFEDMGSAQGYGALADIDRLFDEFQAGGLKPMIRVSSGHGRESTYICTEQVGKSTRMLIATFDRNEATVIEAEVNLETLMKMVGDPERAGQMFGMRHDRDRDW
jgi:hypothetical protein